MCISIGRIVRRLCNSQVTRGGRTVRLMHESTRLLRKDRCPRVTRVIGTVVQRRGGRDPCCHRIVADCLRTLICRVFHLGRIRTRAELRTTKDKAVQRVTSTLAFIGSRCRRRMGIYALTRIYKVDRASFQGIFRRCIRVLPVSCIGLIHMRCTYRRVGRNGSSVSRITEGTKFSAASAFGQGFGGFFGASPCR